MKPNLLLAYAEAIFVTILWSSSYVLIKYGLNEIPPFLFAAVRYSVAFLFLAIVLIASGKRAHGSLRGDIIEIGGGRILVVAGVCGYTFAQGLQFLGLFYLQAVTTSFILTFTPIFVLLLGILFLGERASKLQLAGLAIALLGSYAFFSGRLSGNLETLGVVITVCSAASWGIYLMIIRRIQRVNAIGSLALTTVTMGVGTAGLLLLAATIDGPRSISYNGWVIILWLGFANTALAFLLWNHALRTIRAYELSVIQNAMLVEIAILALLFLGEQLTISRILGIVLVIMGVVLAQVRKIDINGGPTPLGN